MRGAPAISGLPFWPWPYRRESAGVSRSQYRWVMSIMGCSSNLWPRSPRLFLSVTGSGDKRPDQPRYGIFISHQVDAKAEISGGVGGHGSDAGNDHVRGESLEVVSIKQLHKIRYRRRACKSNDSNFPARQHICLL